MSTDDPGWGGFTPLPGADAPPAAAPTNAAPAAAPAGPQAPGAKLASGLQGLSGLKGLKGLPRLKGAGGSWSKNPKVLLAILVVGILVIISGVKSMTSGASKDDFIKAADQLCTQAVPAMRSAAQQNNLQQLSQLQQQLTAQVRALKQPKALKDKLDQMYALLDADAQALAKGDFNSVQTLERQFPSIGADIGFKVCMGSGG